MDTYLGSRSLLPLQLWLDTPLSFCLERVIHYISIFFLLIWTRWKSCGPWLVGIHPPSISDPTSSMDNWWCRCLDVAFSLISFIKHATHLITPAFLRMGSSTTALWRVFILYKPNTMPCPSCETLHFEYQADKGNLTIFHSNVSPSIHQEGWTVSAFLVVLMHCCSKLNPSSLSPPYLSRAKLELCLYEVQVPINHDPISDIASICLSLSDLTPWIWRSVIG